MELFGFDLLNLFTFETISAILFGTFAGLLIGAIPGLGSTVTVVLLLPFTFAMDPLASILLLLAAFQGSEYGGSISAIVIGIPGTPSAAPTVLDGHSLAKKSSPGHALAYSLIASSIGGLAGGLMLLFFSVPLADFALNLSDPEFFLVALIGLIVVGGLSSRDVTKSMISVVLGLMAGTVGVDILTSAPRFTLGQNELMEGLDLIAVLVGVFAFSQIFIMISEELNVNYITDVKGLKTKITLKEFRGVAKPIGIGSITGAIVGLIPGMGAGPSSWFAYTFVKKASKRKSKFGKGNPEGIAGPEAANNATVGGSMLPMLTLGIPASPAIAIIMGAFIIHGIQPGPSLFASDTDLVYGIFYGFLFTTISMFILGKLVTPLFSRVLTVPNHYLIPIILILALTGAFVSNYLIFDLWVALLIGVAFYFLLKLDFSLPSFILAFILSPIVEESLRRSLLISDGDYLIFLTRPFSLVLVILILLIIIVISYTSLRKGYKRKHNDDETASGT
ncbi:tripartite tricarboxylate transporter permease [Salicibibacter cibarius]|uniref:Tripartite tricarboxylate transporter permease n=1 Tax=Salicibibacter cibarius TaxID=2743000 RepID=A0A7T6Z6E7_9BACI|nr:tripartite tricarboxylate transporter permease [Salicibibacter cibarius]QQK77791.1 tripartite tricarboxylate transporter permease [Salicibibacter cibarius]